MVFVGPLVIKRVVLGYTNGALVPYDITISPMLGVNISRLDFYIANETSEMPLEGFARAIEISWSLFGEKPLLNLKFGPSVIKNFATADSMQIITPFYKDIDWQNLLLVANLEGLTFGSYGHAEIVNLEGSVNFQSANASSVQLDAYSLRAEMDGAIYASDSIEGNISEISFRTPLNEQYFYSILSVKDIELSKANISSPSARIEISATPEAKNLKIDLQDLKFLNFGGSVKKLKVDGNYDREYVLQDLGLDILSGNFAHTLPNFSDISTRIFKTKQDNYDAFSEGNLDEYEISQSGNFIGLLPPSSFEIELI